MNRFLPDKDAELVMWGEKFAQVAGQNLTTLKLTQAEVDGFAKQITTVKDAMTAAEMRRAQSLAATEAKKTARGTAQSAASRLNLRIQGTAGVSDALKVELGLNVKKSSSTRKTPLTPKALVANGFQNGVNKLKWDRSGNDHGTLFLIEAVLPGTDSWTQIGTTLAVRFDHKNQTPGVSISYRIIAQRAEILSPPSNPSTVYGTPSKASLTLVKAA